MPIGLPFEDVDLVALAQPDDCLLPVRAAAGGLADAARLATVVRRPDALDLHPEQLLDRLTNRRLGRFRVNLERVLGAFRLLVRRRRLLGQDRAHDGAVQGWHWLLPLLLGGARLLLRRARRLLRGSLLGCRLLRCRLLLGGGLLRRSLLRGGLLRRRRIRLGATRAARRTVRQLLGLRALRLLRTRRRLLLLDRIELLAERSALDQDVIRPQDVVRRDVAVRHHVRGGDVARAEEDIRLHAVRQD